MGIIMKKLLQKFYAHGAKGLFHQGRFSIANWFGNIEFQILEGNSPIICCRVENGTAIIEKISDKADRYMDTIISVVSEHHVVA